MMVLFYSRREAIIDVNTLGNRPAIGWNIPLAT